MRRKSKALSLHAWNLHLMFPAWNKICTCEFDLKYYKLVQVSVTEHNFDRFHWMWTLWSLFWASMGKLRLFPARSVAPVKRPPTSPYSQFAPSKSSPALTVRIWIAFLTWKFSPFLYLGACISMDRRCDQFPNCQDFSDEESPSQTS